MVGGVTAIQYGTALNREIWLSETRELYFIPVILGGLWFGKKWGLANSFLVSLVYSPLMFGLVEPELLLGEEMSPMFWYSFWGSGIEVVLFNVAGFLAGVYGDARRGFGSKRLAPPHLEGPGRNILFYVDETSVSVTAAHYVARVFSPHSEQKFVLFSVSAQKDDEFYPDPGVAGESGHANSVSSEDSVDRIRQILIDAGISPAAIEVKASHVQKRARISDRLLGELQKGDYHTIVLGKYHLTKAEEFLFGSKAIRLVREAGVNVISVKGPVARESQAGQAGPPS
jgi:nucleotide-binding universal stress UspA family protein